MRGAKNLTEGPIVRQLFNLAMPIMGTSFIQMAYSITDMAWVGRLGSEAVAAVGAVGILTWMTNSISYLSKVGSEVSVAQSIGIRDEAVNIPIINYVLSEVKKEDYDLFSAACGRAAEAAVALAKGERLDLVMNRYNG